MQDTKVGFELFLNEGPLHLDCEFFAVASGRDMNLGNRSGRMRHGIERRKYLLRKRTEFLKDGLADRLVWNSRCLVEQLQQLGAVFLRQQVEPQRERLSDLDPSSAQGLEKETQTYLWREGYFSRPKRGENIESRTSRNNLAKTSHRQKQVANSAEGQLLITRANHSKRPISTTKI